MKALAALTFETDKIFISFATLKKRRLSFLEEVSLEYAPCSGGYLETLKENKISKLPGELAFKL